MDDAGTVRRVVARAREAWESWRGSTWSARAGVLKRIRRAVVDRESVWIGSLVEQLGKPRVEALQEFTLTIDAIDWTIRRGRSTLRPRWRFPGRQVFLTMPMATVERVPRGVVGIWGAWNFPLFLNLPPLAQALAAGNAVILKNSELVPHIGLEVEGALRAAEVPSGLARVIQGGPELGAALARADVDFGVYTGGLKGGRAVSRELGSRGRGGVYELSGYDPAIVLDDAALEPTARALVWSAFHNAGQTCAAVKRVRVPEGQRERWVEALVRAAGALRVGNPAEEEVDLGPMISESALNRFVLRVRAAVAAGAEIRCGGQPLFGRAGYFHSPTILLSGSKSSEPERALEGVFGPAMLVRPYERVEDAVNDCNALGEFALGASVWGRDRSRANRVADGLRGGLVTVNEATLPVGLASSPFGGERGSGHGRVHGPEGLLEFTQTRVRISRSERFAPRLHLGGNATRLEGLLRLYRRWIQR